MIILVLLMNWDGWDNVGKTLTHHFILTSNSQSNEPSPSLSTLTLSHLLSLICFALYSPLSSEQMPLSHPYTDCPQTHSPSSTASQLSFHSNRGGLQNTWQDPSHVYLHHLSCPQPKCLSTAVTLSGISRYFLHGPNQYRVYNIYLYIRKRSEAGLIFAHNGLCHRHYVAMMSLLYIFCYRHARGMRYVAAPDQLSSSSV